MQDPVFKIKNKIGWVWWSTVFGWSRLRSKTLSKKKVLDKSKSQNTQIHSIPTVTPGAGLSHRTSANTVDKSLNPLCMLGARVRSPSQQALSLGFTSSTEMRRLPCRRDRRGGACVQVCVIQALCLLGSTLHSSPTELSFLRLSVRLCVLWHLLCLWPVL